MCYSAKIQTFSPTKHTLSFHRLAALFVYQHRVHARDFSKEKKSTRQRSARSRADVPCRANGNCNNQALGALSSSTSWLRWEHQKVVQDLIQVYGLCPAWWWCWWPSALVRRRGVEELRRTTGVFFFVPRKIIVCINVRTARNVSFHALEDADGSGNQSCLDSSVVPVDAYHLGHFSAQVNRFHSQ